MATKSQSSKSGEYPLAESHTFEKINECFVSIRKFIESSSHEGLSDLVSDTISRLSDKELILLASKIYDEYPLSKKAETVSILLTFNTENFKTELLSFNYSSPMSVTEI
jgi:hypothetical protein